MSVNSLCGMLEFSQSMLLTLPVVVLFPFAALFEFAIVVALVSFLTALASWSLTFSYSFCCLHGSTSTRTEFPDLEEKRTYTLQAMCAETFNDF